MVTQPSLTQKSFRVGTAGLSVAVNIITTNGRRWLAGVTVSPVTSVTDSHHASGGRLVVDLHPRHLSSEPEFRVNVLAADLDENGMHFAG